MLASRIGAQPARVAGLQRVPRAFRPLPARQWKLCRATNGEEPGARSLRLLGKRAPRAKEARHRLRSPPHAHPLASQPRARRGARGPHSPKPRAAHASCARLRAPSRPAAARAHARLLPPRATPPALAPTKPAGATPKPERFTETFTSSSAAGGDASDAAAPGEPPIEFKLDFEPVAPAVPAAGAGAASAASAAAPRPLAAAADLEVDDGEPSAVQKFLFPDKEELPDDFEVRGCAGAGLGVGRRTLRRAVQQQQQQLLLNV